MSLAPRLLRSLDPLAVAAGADIPDAVTIDGTTFSRSDLLGAATSVAERIARAERVAVLARPTASTVLAVVGCLIAGVTVVPVPPDSGTAELDHMLADSGAQAWLGEAPDSIVDFHLVGGDQVISTELLRVSAAIAAFSGLYYAIAVLTDSTYLEEFLSEVTEEMRTTFAARSEYLALRQ